MTRSLRKWYLNKLVVDSSAPHPHEAMLNQGSESRDELPLTGGRITKGVVRIGNTVVRPTNPASGAVASLLRHLEKKGFEGAPRYLGNDRRGRDVFSYIAGNVPLKWQLFPDETIATAARLLRAFHDATLGSQLLQGKSVICHNDPGPNNVVFQDGQPAAFIDFDMMAPGERLEDLGYMAWSWCISSKSARQPVSTQARQVGILARCYGIGPSQARDLVDSILERQVRNIELWLQKRGGSDRNINEEKVDEMVEWSRREYAYTVTHRTEFVAALG
jgi:Phosphotransferase enzyme family